MADSVNTTPLPGAGRRKSAGALVPTKPADLPPLTPDQLNDQDGEPRVLDLTIAERLGMADRHKIRSLIVKNRAELESYGPLVEVDGVSARQAETYGEVRDTVSQTSDKGGRPGKAYYLNEGQALVICALSRTPQAALVRRQIIEVFLAYRRGVLPVAEEQQQTIAHLAAELADLRQRVALIGAAPHIRAIFKGGFLPGSTALTVQDISMEWDEPRISDQRLAVQLGLPDMHTVRKLIRSHRSLLAGLGRIVNVPQAKETVGKGDAPGVFWLTELQSLAVCGLVSGNVASANCGRGTADVRFSLSWTRTGVRSPVAKPSFHGTRLFFVRFELYSNIGAEKVRHLLRHQITQSQTRSLRPR
ncbi:hypothetical protein FBZ85_105437 [Azospirillum brasilense]|nr:hypothetical protein [Azospirillum baldaniorum]TWA79129.1 hypothetical protein FBZ85_105437 [Azospirillum brasilense]